MSPLCNAPNTWLGQSLPWAHRTHLTTCIIMVPALIQRGEVSLSRWLPYLPCRGLQAESKQRRVSRWLQNSRINIHRLYKPVIKAALVTWGGRCFYLSLDTSLYDDRNQRKYDFVCLHVSHSYEYVLNPTLDISLFLIT